MGEMLTTADLGTCQRQTSASPTFSSFSSFCARRGARQMSYSAQSPYVAHSQDVPIKQKPENLKRATNKSTHIQCTDDPMIVHCVPIITG